MRVSVSVEFGLPEPASCQVANTVPLELAAIAF